MEFHSKMFESGDLVQQSKMLKPPRVKVEKSINSFEFIKYKGSIESCPLAQIPNEM